MKRHKKKVIELKGKNPQPELYEINELGLQGWVLVDVRRQCKKEIDEYHYSKRKWWAFLF